MSASGPVLHLHMSVYERKADIGTAQAAHENDLHGGSFPQS